MRRLALLFAVASLPTVAPAQGFPLTVESIMRGPDVVGTAPSNVRFAADGRYVYFGWRSPGVDTLDMDYRVAVSGAPQPPERLPRFAVDTIAMADGAWSPDPRREVVVLHAAVPGPSSRAIPPGRRSSCATRSASCSASSGARWPTSGCGPTPIRRCVVWRRSGTPGAV